MLSAFYQLPNFLSVSPYLTFTGHIWKSQVHPFYYGKQLLLKNLIPNVLHSTPIVSALETVEQLVNRYPSSFSLRFYYLHH